MNLKKPIAALSALAVALGVTACGKTETTTFSFSDGLDENGFFTGVKATDYVTLPEYKGIEVSKDVLVAKEEDIQAQIDGVLENSDSYDKITDRALKDGDTVNIDYVGSVDGVEFDGGSTGGAGTVVTIGVTSYIDDFLEQLIGHKPGESFDIEVTFPDPYQNDETLSGKDAIFNVTINYIMEYKLTDELAASYGFDTVDAMVADIEVWLINRQKGDILNGILEQAAVSEIPQVVLDYVINYDLFQLSQTAQVYGLDAATFLMTFYGFASVEDYKTANVEMYEANAKMYLAAQAMAELEGITITEADLEAEGLLAEVENYGLPYLKQYLLVQLKLPQLIIDNAVIK